MSIQRHASNARLSQAVTYNGIAYLSGQVADDDSAQVAEQTRQVLTKIDRLLAECGADKSKLLSAQVWLADIKDFPAMNQIWESWTAPGQSPARATVEARLAKPGLRVEVQVLAALS